MSCYQDTPTEPVDTSLKPEFVLNKIHCTFRIVTDINTAAKETTVVTRMTYGLDAYYHNQYGLISKQIVSYLGQTDTLFGSNVDSKPDVHNAPVGTQEYIVPNMFNGIDSVKMFVKLFGTFYSDAQLLNGTSNFYHYDSTFVRITTMTMVRP